MEVEVIGIEVGEDGDVEVAFVDAVEGEAVRSGFDDGVAAAGVDHLREHLLDLGRFGGGEAAGVRQKVVADATFGGSDEARFLAGGGEDVVKEMRQAGLAIRAGDADGTQAARGVAEDGGGDLRKRSARIGDDEGWDLR